VRFISVFFYTFSLSEEISENPQLP